MNKNFVFFLQLLILLSGCTPGIFSLPDFKIDHMNSEILLIPLDTKNKPKNEIVLGLSVHSKYFIKFVKDKSLFIYYRNDSEWHLKTMPVQFIGDTFISQDTNSFLDGSIHIIINHPEYFDTKIENELVIRPTEKKPFYLVYITPWQPEILNAKHILVLIKGEVLNTKNDENGTVGSYIIIR